MMYSWQFWILAILEASAGPHAAYPMQVGIRQQPDLFPNRALLTAFSTAHGS